MNHERSTRIGASWLLGLILLSTASAIIFASVPTLPTTKANVGSWTSTTAIPTSGLYSIVITGGNIFAVGGGSASGTHTYYNSETSGGLGGSWTSGTTYPVSLNFPPSCPTDGSYIYCVGGTTSSAPVYSSPLSGPGIGTWTVQPSYPINIERQSCVISTGYIYCVGGYTGSKTAAAYYATASSGTIGSWTSTNAYPVATEDPVCVAMSGVVICAGGLATLVPFAGTTGISYASYKGTLSSSGIVWSARSVMPTAFDFQSCFAVNSYDYCTGGMDYHSNLVGASLSNATVLNSPSLWPNWQTDLAWGPSAPVAPGANGCAADTSSNTVFCIGGATNTALSTFTASTEYSAITALPTTLNWNAQTPITGGGTSQSGGGAGYNNGIFSSCVWVGNVTGCVQANGTTRYAKAFSNNGTVKAWTKSTSYPLSFTSWSPTCVESAGYVTCIGGCSEGPNHSDATCSSAVYYDTLGPSGFGVTWTSTTSYPITILGPGCVVALDWVYCVGGSTDYTGSGDTAASYAGQLSAGSVVAWHSGTNYVAGVAYDLGCAPIHYYTINRIICSGGSIVGAPVYKATLTTSAPYISAWSLITSNQIGASTGIIEVKDNTCASNNVTIFCIGGAIYSNHLSSTVYGSDIVVESTDFGVTWTRQSNLPYGAFSWGTGMCFFGGITYLFCAGGSTWTNDTDIGTFYTNQVYSAKTLGVNHPFALDGHGANGCATQSCAASLTTVWGHDGLIVFTYGTDSASAATFCTVTSISDGSNTYHQRGSDTQYTYSGGTWKSHDMEEWYTTTGAPGSLTVTVTSSCASNVNLYVRLMGASGANVNGSFFDPNVSLPGHQGNNYPPGAHTPNATVSTSNANDMLISDSTFGNLYSTVSGSVPSGFTSVDTGQVGSAYDIVTSTQSSVKFTWTGSGNALPDGVIVDALEEAPVPVTFGFTCSISQFGSTSMNVALTVSSGTVSPTSAPCSNGGSTTALTAGTGTTVTATTPSISAGRGYWFASLSNTTTDVASSSAWSVTAYQLSTVFAKVQANAQTNFDTGMTFTFTCTQAGAGGTCTISSAASSSITKYFKVDYKSNLVFPTNPSSPPANSRWQISPALTQNVTTTAQTYTGQYWKQWTETWTGAANARATFDATMTGTVTGNQFGSSATICTITTTSGHSSDSCSAYIDNNQAATFATTLTGAPANEQWKCNTCTTGAQTTGGNVVTINYFAQLTNTYQATTNGAGPPTWDTGLSAAVKGTVFGVGSTTICTISPSSGTTTTASCSGYTDYNTAASLPLILSGAASGTQWHVVGTHSWTDTSGGNTHTATYYKQVNNGFQINAQAQSVFDGGLSAVAVTGTVNGTGSTTLCSITVTAAASDSCSPLWSDYGLVATVPSTISGAAANTRWLALSTTSGSITTGSGTINYNYYKQVNNTYTATPHTPSTWDNAYGIPITGLMLGSSGTICTISATLGGGSASCFGFFDYSASANFPNTVGTNWMAQGTTTFPSTTGGNTFTVLYNIVVPPPASGLITLTEFGAVFSIIIVLIVIALWPKVPWLTAGFLSVLGVAIGIYLTYFTVLSNQNGGIITNSFLNSSGGIVNQTEDATMFIFLVGAITVSCIIVGALRVVKR